MSIKAYYAWRVPAAKLEAFAEQFEAYMLRIAVDRFLEIPLRELPELPKNADTVWHKKDQGSVRQMIGQVKKAYYASKASMRDPICDVDCGYNVFTDGGNLVIVPWGEYYLYSNFQEESKGVWRDWAYWNNTDPDEDVPAREWNARRRFWEDVYDHDKRFARTVINMSDTIPRAQFMQTVADHVGVKRKDDSSLWSTGYVLGWIERDE
jgi:hypothetical protein